MRAPQHEDRDRQLLERANRQWGLVRDEDLERVGLDRHATARRVAAGRLTRLSRGVYALGHTCLRDEGRWLAGVWLAGDGSALSHASSARYHRVPLPADVDDAVHVTTTRCVRSAAGVVVHRARHLERIDVLDAHPLRVTHLPRTLVDLADVLPWVDYRALVDGLPRVPIAQLRAAQSRTPKRRGAPLVTRLLEADEAHTKSEFERRFLRFLDSHALSRPDALNATVAHHSADCVYRFAGRPLRGLVVELDGRAHHDRRRQMRADRHRDTDYQLAGYLILRLVWDDLHPGEARRTVDRLRRLLAA